MKGHKIRKRDPMLPMVKALIPFWNIMMFSYVWVLYYNDKIFAGGWQKGLAISIALYAAVYISFGRLYNAFKVGAYRVSELFFSQLLAFGIADLLMYLECCMIHKGMVSVVPGGVAVILQILGSIALTILANSYFEKCIPPQETIIIYGEGDVDVFAQKLERKTEHIFYIKELCSEDADDIKDRIKAYDTVILYKVSEDVRVKVMERCLCKGKDVYVTPRLEDIMLTTFENQHYTDTPLMKHTRDNSRDYYGKRIFDILFSVIMLIVFSPFMLITAIGIKLEDGGSVFYKQKRVTKRGRVFEILKFRSMVEDAESSGYKACTAGDSRITKVGKIIRATRIDETPQLINVIKGDMSIVGPRPERVEHVEKYTAELPEFEYRLRVRGGLTGYAQIYGKYNTSAEDKLKMDLMYIEKQSLLVDLQLVFLTIKTMFTPESTEGFEETGNSAESRETADNAKR